MAIYSWYPCKGAIVPIKNAPMSCETISVNSNWPKAMVKTGLHRGKQDIVPILNSTMSQQSTILSHNILESKN